MKKTESSMDGDSASDKPPLCGDGTDAVVRECPLSPRLSEWAAGADWTDWRWQMRSRLRSIPQLRDAFPGMRVPPSLSKAAARFPMAITPYYASLIRKFHDRDPIYQMCVPRGRELCDPDFLREDPLEEDEDMPVSGLVHRYPDRALVIVSTTCAMYCRHCTRKRVAGSRETTLARNQLQQIAAYLAAHPEIHDVIISGGDPFTMATEALEEVLRTIRAIPSVKIIRIGTRTPVVLPMRITDELVNMLRRYHPLWVNTHFNHPNELTPQAAAACAKLVDAGIPLGNQTVLLRGVNDAPQVMEQLCRSLVRNRVRPYYLFQCDLVRGVEHFRTPISRGIEIMEYLRGRLSGLAIPTFVVDAPHGGGKIPLLPNYIISTSPTHTVLRNFEGLIVSYPEPQALGPDDLAAPVPSAEPLGVWEVACGQKSKIQPSRSVRHERRSAAVCAGGDGSPV